MPVDCTKLPGCRIHTGRYLGVALLFDVYDRHKRRGEAPKGYEKGPVAMVKTTAINASPCWHRILLHNGNKGLDPVQSRPVTAPSALC